MEFHKILLITNGQFHIYQYYMSGNPKSIQMIDDDIIDKSDIDPPSCFVNITNVTNLKCKGTSLTIRSSTSIMIGASRINLRLIYTGVYLITNFVQHKNFVLPTMDECDCIIFAGNNIMIEKDSYDNFNSVVPGIDCNSSVDAIHSSLLRKYNALFSSEYIKTRPIIMLPTTADMNTSSIVQDYITCLQLRWDKTQTGVSIDKTFFIFVNPVLYPNIKPVIVIPECNHVCIIGPSKLFIQDSPDIISSLSLCKKMLNIKMIDEIPNLAPEIIDSVKIIIRDSLEKGSSVLCITYDGRLGTHFSFNNINNRSYEHINVGPHGCKVRYNKMMDQMLPQTIKSFSFLPEYTIDRKDIIFHRNIVYLDLPTSTYKFINLDDLI
jgi:hypothetical protein